MARIGAAFFLLLTSVTLAEPSGGARSNYTHDLYRTAYALPTDGNPGAYSPSHSSVPPGFPSVRQILHEIAQGTVEKVTDRFRDLVIQFGTQGVLLVQQSIEELLNKNLSTKELAILSTVLEMASDEQIREAASGLRGGALKFGPWSHLAQAMASHLARRHELVPELRALKMLADQTLQIMALSPAARKEFRRSQANFREAMLLLGDDQIDGRGLMKLAVASGSILGAALREVGRDVKTSLQPDRLEKTIDAALLLANTFANADPASKAMLRPILVRELERDRIQVGPDGRVNWRSTLGQMASLAPDDARTVSAVLKQHRLVSEDEAQRLERAIAHTEDARRTYYDLARFSRTPSPRTPEEFQRQMEDVKQLATQMNRRGQLGDDEASGVFRVAAALSAVSSAREAGSMIQENLQNPIVRRRVGLPEVTATAPTPMRVTR